jgi:hypothetical protein
LQVAGILPLRTAFLIASLKAVSTAQSSSRPIFGIVDQKPTRLNKVASGRRHFEETGNEIQFSPTDQRALRGSCDGACFRNLDRRLRER